MNINGEWMDEPEIIALISQLTEDKKRLEGQLDEAERLVTQLKAELCDSSEYCEHCDKLDMSERGYVTCKYKKKKIPEVCFWQLLTPAHFDDISWTENEG